MTMPTDLTTRAQDVLTVRRVFGEPIEREEVTVGPAARFTSGGGAGTGDRGPDGGGGTGGGRAQDDPVSAFVIRDGALRWRRPRSTSNRVVLVAQLVVVTALLTLRLYLKLRVACLRRRAMSRV